MLEDFLWRKKKRIIILSIWKKRNQIKWVSCYSKNLFKFRRIWL